MTAHDHCFVREQAPDASAYCPDCGDLWEFCRCELPEFAEIRDAYVPIPYERSH